MLKKTGRTVFLSLLMGIWIAFCCEVGARIGAVGEARLPASALCVRLAVKSLLYGLASFLAWELPGRIGGRPSGRRRRAAQQRLSVLKSFTAGMERCCLSFRGSFLLLLAMWLPVWLSIFPGAFAYDAPMQWQQFRDGAITAHHPVLHTLLLGLCLEGGAKLVSYNFGIALYTLLQMAAMAAVLSYALAFLRRYGMPARVRTCALFFWGLSPVTGLFVVSSTKDILFTAAFLLFLLSLMDYGMRREALWRSRSGRLLFWLSAAGTMVLRKNGLYIVIAVLACMFLLGPERRRFLPGILGLTAFFLLYTGPFYRALGVEKDPVREMLCVPLQQMARTYLYHYGELECGDIEKLEKLVPREDLLNYLPTLADVVKGHLREDVLREDPLGYLKLWAKWGRRYPTVYAESFLINTADYWYPFAVVDGYDPGTERTDFFRYSVGPPGKRVEMLPGLHEMYRAISQERSASQAPLAFLLLSPGWYLLLMVHFFLGFWYLRRGAYLLPCLALGLLELTAMLGPVPQVRYVLALFFFFPVMAAFFLKEQRRRRVEGI